MIKGQVFIVLHKNVLWVLGSPQRGDSQRMLEK